jgi:hypothetical protein
MQLLTRGLYNQFGIDSDHIKWLIFFITQPGTLHNMPKLKFGALAMIILLFDNKT